MKSKNIVFDNNSYLGRIITDNTGKELLIASTVLLDAIQPQNCNESFVNKTAETIYNNIFCFTDKYNLLLDDKQLIASLIESNPDFNKIF